MLAQVLNIVPHGVVESGQIMLEIDETTGLISFSDSITVGFSIFSQVKNGTGEFKIDPKMLLSANVKPGVSISVQNVTIEVPANSSEGTVAYSNGDDHLDGTVDLDLTGEYIVVDHLNLSGVVSGVTVQIELTK